MKKVNFSLKCIFNFRPRSRALLRALLDTASSPTARAARGSTTTASDQRHGPHVRHGHRAASRPTSNWPTSKTTLVQVKLLVSLVGKVSFLESRLS